MYNFFGSTAFYYLFAIGVTIGFYYWIEFTNPNLIKERVSDGPM